MWYKLLVILAVFASACAQMLLKKAANTKYENFYRQYFNACVIGGYSIFAIAMLVNIYAMNKGVQLKEVSVIESLGYLFVPCLSWMFFQEKISWRKAVAILVVMIGVFVFFW